MKNIDHPNIIKLHEIWESENSYYQVLTQCEGGSLTELISTTKNLINSPHINNSTEKIITINETRIFIKQLLEALDYLAQHKIMHRFAFNFLFFYLL
jgi:calcium-dependent protein kinase